MFSEAGDEGASVYESSSEVAWASGSLALGAVVYAADAASGSLVYSSSGSGVAGAASGYAVGVVWADDAGNSTVVGS